MNIYRKTQRFYRLVETEKSIIGRSVLGRKLFAVKVGQGSPVGIAVYAIHGREWASSLLAYEHYRRGVEGSVWLVPLANPDGAMLSQKGIASAFGSAHFSFLSAYTAKQLRAWKANARGVDLNVNFDAHWGTGVKNVRKRGAENYIGERAFSEPETQALRDFTQEIHPDYTVSFHTKGGEIYWCFGQSAENCLRDFTIGQRLSQSTGYPLRLTDSSAGGYKDWCIASLHIPAYTVELGDDRLRHPLGRTAYCMDIKNKAGDALYALSCGVKEWL